MGEEAYLEPHTPPNFQNFMSETTDRVKLPDFGIEARDGIVVEEPVHGARPLGPHRALDPVQEPRKRLLFEPRSQQRRAAVARGAFWFALQVRRSVVVLALGRGQCVKSRRYRARGLVSTLALRLK
jgi:hypothetical protein